MRRQTAPAGGDRVRRRLRVTQKARLEVGGSSTRTETQTQRVKSGTDRRKPTEIRSNSGGSDKWCPLTCSLSLARLVPNQRSFSDAIRHFLQHVLISVAMHRGCHTVSMNVLRIAHTSEKPRPSSIAILIFFALALSILKPLNELLGLLSYVCHVRLGA